jgi:hypothetical protein
MRIMPCEQPERFMLQDGTLFEEFVGRTVRREFYKNGNGWARRYFLGKVKSFKEALTVGGEPSGVVTFLIQYEDKDEEEVEFKDLNKLLIEDDHALITTTASSDPYGYDTEQYNLKFFDHSFHARFAGSLVHAALVSRSHGKISEDSYTDVSFAIKDSPTSEVANLWREAQRQELDKLEKIGAFEWTALNPLLGENAKTPRSLSFPARKKHSADLHGVKYKVRMVSATPKNSLTEPEGGFMSYAPVVSYNDLFLGLAWGVGMHLKMRQLDVEMAYIQALAPRDRMIYRPPAMMKPPDPAKPFLRALRALYGHPESGRAWQLMWVKILRDLAFTNVDRAGTWMKRKDHRGLVTLLTIVDDSAGMF